MQPGKPMRPTLLRFCESYHEDTSGCWLWRRKLARGRAFFSYKGDDGLWRRVQASKMAWRLFRGPIPAGLWVLHRCDVGACVNPDHLFLGTALDNSRDMFAKGRDRLGYCLRKLTDDQAAEARRLHASGHKNKSELARLFGVTHKAMWHLLAGNTYRRKAPVSTPNAKGTAGRR